MESRRITMHYGTAELRGPQGADDLHLGTFSVKAQSMNLIEQEFGSSFRNLPLEGIVGLGFPEMAAEGQRPFFDTVIKQHQLKKNMFCVLLLGRRAAWRCY